MSVVWEWEAKKGAWSGYDEATSAKLSTATAPVEVGGSKLDPTSMTVKGKTGFSRRLRCILSQEDGWSVRWEWGDDKGSWAPYSLPVTRVLEAAHCSDAKSATFTVLDRAYSADLAKMEQTNDDTGVKRDIRRVVVNAADAKENKEEDAPPRRSSRTKSAQAPKPKAKEEVEEKEVKASSSKVSKSIVAKSAAQIEAKSSKRKMVVKGRAAVDAECVALAGKEVETHVYEEGADVYDAMLNQTNVQNNNNKYYIIQLLEEDAAKRYHVWMRWGRVGFKGQSSAVGCGSDLEQAKAVFCQKFSDKTKNEWGSRSTFSKVNGKYDLVQVDYSAAEEEEAPATKVKKESEEEAPTDSKLSPEVQGLMKLICDVGRMEAAVRELEYDSAKAPLGKLTTAQIKAGYAALKSIEDVIKSGKKEQRKMVEACNEYYTRIPHCFGMRTPPLIRDMEALKKELELMEALADIEVAVRTIREGKLDTDDLHPIDRNYNAMKCDLEPLPKEDPMYKLVSEYLKNTHGPTHIQYKMRPKNIFACKKEDEESKYKSDLPNKMLLWHGSRMTNWYGILSKGLRIAPPEAPVTGYMFGKGLYFADISSKSANYCFPSKQNPTGLLLLSEVALGKANELRQAKYDAHKLPSGCQSVKGIGSLIPDPKGDKVVEGVRVPAGKAVKAPTAPGGGYSLNYNEFIVYDTAQVRMRYIVETEFIFP